MRGRAARAKAEYRTALDIAYFGALFQRTEKPHDLYRQIVAAIDPPPRQSSAEIMAQMRALQARGIQMTIRRVERPATTTGIHHG